MGASGGQGLCPCTLLKDFALENPISEAYRPQQMIIPLMLPWPRAARPKSGFLRDPVP